MTCFSLSRSNVISILFFSFSEILSITYPITPRPPQMPSVDNETSGSETSVKKELPRAKKHILITALLGSGDEITGKVYIPESVSFKHYKNGLIYKKTIFLKDIFSIEILRFKKALVKKNKNTTLYEFKPLRVKIITKDKNDFYLGYLFSFLQKINISTQDGETTLFSFFADAFDKKNGWAEVDSKDISYHQDKPHPRSVWKIKFLGPDVE